MFNRKLTVEKAIESVLNSSDFPESTYRETKNRDNETTYSLFLIPKTEDPVFKEREPIGFCSISVIDTSLGDQENTRPSLVARVATTIGFGFPRMRYFSQGSYPLNAETENGDANDPTKQIAGAIRAAHSEFLQETRYKLVPRAVFSFDLEKHLKEFLKYFRKHHVFPNGAIVVEPYYGDSLPSGEGYFIDPPSEESTNRFVYTGVHLCEDPLERCMDQGKFIRWYVTKNHMSTTTSPTPSTTSLPRGMDYAHLAEIIDPSFK